MKEITVSTLYVAEEAARAESISKKRVYYVLRAGDGYTAGDELDYDREFICLYKDGVKSYVLGEGT